MDTELIEPTKALIKHDIENWPHAERLAEIDWDLPVILFFSDGYEPHFSYLCRDRLGVSYKIIFTTHENWLKWADDRSPPIPREYCLSEDIWSKYKAGLWVLD